MNGKTTLGFRDIALDLQRRIEGKPSTLRPEWEQQWEAGDRLPSIASLMETYGVAKNTIVAAIEDLENKGLISRRDRARAVVRTKQPIRIPLSRYGKVMKPGGAMGPWETACAEQGLEGRMHLVHTGRVKAGDDLAALLHIDPTADLVFRLRHAIVEPDDTVQIQYAWYPADLINQTELTSTTKIKGGVLGAFIEAGIVPDRADEEIEAGLPTPEEREKLGIGAGVPVMRIQRVTFSAGKPIEVLRVVTPADRAKLVYDGLPLHAKT